MNNKSTKVKSIMLNYIVAAVCLLILQCDDKGTNTEDDAPADSLNEYSQIDTINYGYADSLLQNDSMVYTPCNYVFPNEAQARVLIWQSGMTDTILDSTAMGISMALSDGRHDIEISAQNYVTDTTYYNTMAQDHQSCYYSIGLFYETDDIRDSLFIDAWGCGKPNPKDPIAVQRAGALRVAKLNMRDNALHHVGQLHYAADSTYESLILKYKNIRNNIAIYLGSILIEHDNTYYLSDGSVAVYSKIPLTGKDGLSKEIFK